MKHSPQAISTVPSSPRVVLDISGEPASLAANETLTSLLTASGQIKFPSTQNPSADANTLDDYEEGTFTPTIVGTTVAGVGTYLDQTGVYTKIGRLVTITIVVTWTAHTGTGNIFLAGLPFTSSSSVASNPLAISASNLTYTANSQVTCGINASATTINMLQFSNGTPNATVPMDTAATIRVAGSYIV